LTTKGLLQSSGLSSGVNPSDVAGKTFCRVTKGAHRVGFLFAFSARLLALNPPGINDLHQAFSFINGPANRWGFLLL
jgi:hypothetical protein